QTSSKSQEQSKQITNLQENFNKLAKAVAGLKQNSLAEDTGLPKNFYGDDDPVEDLRKQFDDLTLNMAKLAKGENQKETSTSSKSQNKSTILEQNIQRILLDMLKKELEKSLYTTLESKAEINDFCEKLQKRYEKLLEYISSRDYSINKEKINLNLDRNLELLFFISVLREVDFGYKVSLPICLKFSDEVDETSVDIGNISVKM
ncbi:17691_t:CDS:2, partial [Gigaspora margarita]